MPWGRVDDSHYRHRKLAELREDLRKGCIALYWLAISWSNDQLTDGRVTKAAVRMLGGSVDEADELVRVALWESDGNAYGIHDYLHFNKSREQVEADRAQRSAAGAAGAAARWHGKSSSVSLDGSYSGSPSETDGRDDAPSPVSRTPVSTSPNPAPERAREIDSAESIFALIEAKGATVDRGNGHAKMLRDQVAAHGIDAVRASIESIEGPVANAGDVAKYVGDALRPRPPAKAARTAGYITPTTRYGDAERASDAGPGKHAAVDEPPWLRDGAVAEAST